MPRLPSLSALFARLAGQLGRRDAANEFRWLRQSLSRPIDEPLLLEMLAERVRGKPLQYILGAYSPSSMAMCPSVWKGTVPFGSLTLKIRPPTLIPRSETEEWTLRLAAAMLHTKDPPKTWKVIDLCTGSGCIPLLLCATLPSGTVNALGVDISEEACQLALENANLHGFAATNGEDSPLRIIRQDICSPAFLSQFEPNSFHVLTCNPPYIPYEQYVQLPHSVKDFEDPRALLGDPYLLPANCATEVASQEPNTGLFYYRLLATIIPRLLRPKKSVCALEVGIGQAISVEAMLRETQFFRRVEVWKDGAGIGRTVIAVN